MNDIGGNKALSLAIEISKLPDATFTIAFYKYNAKKDEASDTLKVFKNCKARKQLPDERFYRDSENYFLFADEDGNPKTAYRILIRFISFSTQGNQLRKVNWT